ncbi:MAG: phosphate/phosphite/phosphonate ABC transporter substrate-binding protein [Deltaproteobacteria bacterium]|jgi:phosphonate transport system substrate-binding protein|nr:phosphate/phosphite/phosphonate ABC transporter substrate-binding protein [Deltaproteobacteria bacterium]MBW2478182.1 phosphate/phosphite/phosphonate ABC transporter substrate-binding protein [Deltaproteobacteria bacterium]MBW2504808.1 phosphate/phosphite/phosphonate ABC transporter substrate-binding protein [Deltaproteobacteria bacterium]MBW2520324.1 phosphate/phosphite/phosphonate ABC transporter substrate-binding protein [Deltaproteobacteria bacterium]
MPTRFTLIAILVSLFVIMGVTGCDKTVSGPVVRIGYMNCNSAAETLQRFKPLTAYLSEQLGRPCEAVPVDTQDFEEQFAAGAFDFGHFNSLLYIILKENQDVQLLATEKRGQFGSSTAGAIIVRRDSSIQSLADLRGKRMIYGPQLAPTGYLAQYNLMLDAGIDPERDLDYYAIPRGSFKHEKVIYGVYFGAFDAAAAPVLDLEIMTREGKISANDFRVLAQSEIIPYCTFGAAKNVDEELAVKFRQALLELGPDTTVTIDGEQVKVLKAAWIDGFEQREDRDYDLIRKMARRANMPPYQEF